MLYGACGSGTDMGLVIKATICGLRPSEGNRRASNDTNWSMNVLPEGDGLEEMSEI